MRAKTLHQWPKVKYEKILSEEPQNIVILHFYYFTIKLQLNIPNMEKCACVGEEGW